MTADFDQLWDYDRPAETEAKFRALLPEIAGEVSLHAQLLTQIARAQGLQRRFESAHRTLDEAQELLERGAHHTLDGAERLITPDLARARLRCRLERGRVFNSSGQPKRARPLFLEVWDQARAAGEDSYAVDAAHMLGIVEPPEAQLAWNLKALKLAETSADPRARRWLGSLYNNLGWTYHGQEQHDRALELFEKALRFREAQGQPRETRIARWCVARALRSLGRLDEALALQRALLDELEASGEKDGYVFEELGECLLALGQPEAARPYFALAHAALSQDPWLAEDEPARLERLKMLGGVS
jgi:tetratricopeptide (TPR) repeat protein